VSGREGGFTLIEIIMAIALVGILSFIAYPKYNEHVIRVRRSVMVVTLMDLAGYMEQYYLEHNTYNGALDKLNEKDLQNKNYYKLNRKIDDDKYVLEAIPVNSQVKDVVCGVLFIDQDGNKGVKGASDIDRCWR
jgi:type IV pilus assembly protein PilE